MNTEVVPQNGSTINIGSLENIVKEVHLNVSQEVIVTTEDKLKLCLTEYLGKVECKRAWIAPFGILLSVIVTLVTTTFKNTVLEAATWKAIFVIVAITSGIWLVCTLKYAFRAITINSIINELKKGTNSLKTMDKP